MKIEELLTESQQLQEGPVGDVATKIAKGAGKAIGGVGKVAGAIAGIPGGVKRAFQQGKQASQDVIGGTGQGADAPYTAPVGTARPTQQTAAPAATPAPTAQQINQQGPSGTAPVKSISGVAKQAIQKTAQAVKGAGSAKAGETLYAQVKSQVNQLDKKGKQRILQLLQKSIQQAPAAAPAAPKAAAPAAKPAATATPAAQAAPVDVDAEKRKDDLYGKGVRPTTKDEKRAAFRANNEKLGLSKKKPAASQAQIDADRDRLMGVTSDSVIRTGKVVAESFSLYRKK
jgi:hypothetical protein